MAQIRPTSSLAVGALHGTDCASAAVKVTKGNANLPDGPCRALLCGTAGTINIIDISGNTCTDLPLQKGYNPIAVSRVSSGGTADDIWALY